MAHPFTAAELTRHLASRHRVIVLGGLALIAHGHTRPTLDADVWLDPNLSIADWSLALLDLLGCDPRLCIVKIGTWEPVNDSDLPMAIEEDRVVRMIGAAQPLDIFREPNELDMTEFDEVWERATPLNDGSRIPDAVDLLITKQSTGRDKDALDIAFLESKIQRQYLRQLPGASGEEAIKMLERFLTPKVAGAAACHPTESVRALGRKFLVELAAEGDPFAGDILRQIQR